ncbi:methylmalonyl-CoA carboxyltransferase [Sneathiella sp. P13V-1]|uniref:acyl-CoA carboxylase subunit beta n=1 Tax=Sneathiella sp. P13V-1 TaxID=2697366 RepID=UPI00187B7342|nr:carboxyl transferase domain-containing protein [Sneathiella sp. P13V-1]MBE7636361.1 methylmalonyl-CoA carboxyltransferase [Sneathiella sp. P13V-1]
MSWEKEINELKHRQELGRQMGGEEKLARHINAGKLPVRERIDKLLDDGSFHEVGTITGKVEYDEDGNIKSMQPANLITGRGKINGRNVVVAGDDFTVRGGANDAGIREKLTHVEMMAGQLQLPLIRLVDGTGGGGSVKTIETEGRTYIPAVRGWEHVVENLSTVPVVGLALGSTAGLGAARVAASHYSVMVKETSQMFVAGPPVVARVGEKLDKNELGGSDIHTTNGAVDDEVRSEEEAFEYAAKFLSYLPNSVHELPERNEITDDPERSDDWLIEAIPRNPRQVYKMRKIIKSVVDKDSFFEMGKKWGRSVITGFARIDGWPVAVMASDPYHYAGAWTADAADKALRFVDIAETFHLPVVHLVDIPGFLVGREAEEQATIRHGVRTMSGIFQATVPWCSIIIRKCYGVAGAAHMNASRFNIRYAWPSGDWGSLPIAGGLEAAYKSDLEASDDPEAKLKEIEERLDRLRSPFRTAERFMVEEIIDPRSTRKLLCEFANLAAPLRKAGRPSFGVRP